MQKSKETDTDYKDTDVLKDYLKISRLIDIAEDEMYDNKKKFHDKYPMYSRN